MVFLLLILPQIYALNSQMKFQEEFKTVMNFSPKIFLLLDTSLTQRHQLVGSNIQ